MRIRPLESSLFVAAVVGCVGSAFAAAAEKIDYANPPAGVFLDDWMAVEIMGERAGYAHNEVTRVGDEIHTALLMSMSIKRAGAAVAIHILQTTRETLAGEPRAFTSRMDMSRQTVEKHGRIDDGKVHITTRQFGVSTTEEYDYPAGALMSWGMLREQHARGFAEGTEYAVRMYEPTFSASSAIDVEMQVLGNGPIALNGETVEAIETKQRMMGMVTTSWLSAAGEFLRTEVAMMGVPMTMTRTTRERALAEFSPPEFFTPTTIKADRRIDRHKAQRVEYLLKLRDATYAMPVLPETSMQKVTEQGRGEARLVVSRLDHAPLRNVPAQAVRPEVAEFLAANPLINCDDPAVKAMAAEARGDAQRPYEIADRLRVYVTDVIADKNLDVGFATASEVCRDKQGDCSEHAVLLAALGRACGLPTRVVTGIVYVPVFGGQQDIFGFHMWTQFLIGDTWVDFDAAQRESDCNATHIAFSVSSLRDAGLGAIAFGLINVIGNLDLHVTRIEPEEAGSSRAPQG